MTPLGPDIEMIKEVYFNAPEDLNHRLVRIGPIREFEGAQHGGERNI